MASDELTDTRMPTISENGFERQNETLTLEDSTSVYRRSCDERRTHLMEVDQSVPSKDNGISESKSSSILSCILCMECIGDQNALQQHLIKNHEVKPEALHAFMSLVDFGDKDVFQNMEQTKDRDRRKLSDSVTGVKDRLKLTSSSSSIDYESDNLVINLEKNDVSTEESKEAESAKDDHLGESEQLVKGNGDSGVGCGLCSAIFLDCDSLFKHQDETGHLSVCMTSTGPCYVCWHAKCDQTFPTTTLLRRHYVGSHFKGRSDPPATSDPAAEAGGEQFLCRQCGHVFQKKEEFRMHCYCHEMEKAMECSSCRTRFNSILEFRKHKQVVHNEELTSEQQELYKASLAAASSLALLGASGLEYVAIHASSETSNLTGVKERDGQGGENGSAADVVSENSATEDKADSRLDENSNSCVRSTFDGIKGIDGSFEDNLKPNGSERVGCNHNGLLHNRCHSCEVGLNRTNGLPECEQTEKHKRKRSRPAKVVSDLSKQKPVNDISSVWRSEPGSIDASIMDLTAGTGSKNPLTMSVPSAYQLPSSFNSALTNSTSLLSHSGCSPTALHSVDRPFRCSLCKVSYTQKAQLDGHLASQQHLSRCAKISDPLTRQQTSTNVQMMSPFAGNNSDQMNQFAELMRQRKVPIPSFLPFGVPLINPLMLTGCVMPSVAGPGIETAFPSSSSTAKPVSKESKHQKVESKSEPVSSVDLASKLLPCDDAEERTEFPCTRCCEMFSSVEQLNRHLEETECAHNILAPDLHSSKCSQTMMEDILQRIGYECVKQFNEYRQKPKRSNKHISSAEFGKGEEVESVSNSKEHVTRIAKELENKRNSENCPRVSEENVNRYLCWTCSKSFSSIFVLKAHQEQVHKQVIPIDVVEKLHNELKANYEKICEEEDSESSEMSGEKRRLETTSAAQRSKLEEEIKLKQQQQQQLQLAAAIQSMQMNIMMSMGMLPQVFPRLPGSVLVPPDLMAPQSFPVIDPMLMMQIRQQQCKTTPPMALSMASPTQPSSTAAANQKSARTRISEQQLQVLRANFDINNSPTEEQIQEMSEKTGLVMKVIKHWFRNTLFKERQRNKDSPYNFNVPPATTLNLEDCELTPKVTVVKEISSSSDENSAAASNSNCDLLEQQSDTAVAEMIANPEMMTSNTVMAGMEKAPSSKMPSRADGKSTATQSASQAVAEFKLMDGLDAQHGISLNAVMMNNLYNLSPALNVQERRAGRTRFSNHQNQVLQEFFDRNPYPRDDEVEALSRALNLRVRVIVVWFQNARQRVRKIEGQTSLPEGSKPAQFHCLKCPLSFDQQIDQLQHQLTEHSLSKDFGYGASSSNELGVDNEEQGSRSSLGNEPDYDNGEPRSIGGTKLECDKCDMTFEFADQLNDHQRETHGHNPSALSHSAGTARQQLDASQKLMPELSRKVSEDGSVFRQSSDDEEHRADRRMRTTLAQDQLDYLYQKFAVESNPSRSALEAIAAHLNLKPRVVQVWFQNTRARERRGQHRVNSQKSLTRCSYCSSTFRGKFALDAHIAEQHPQTINNITYPVDLVRNIQGISSGMESVVPPFLAPSPMMNAAGISALQTNIHYLYEKSFQQYMSKLTNLQSAAQLPSSASSSNQSVQSAPNPKPPKPSVSKTEEGPLDLTVSGTTASQNDHLKTEPVDISHAPFLSSNLDDSYSETYSENDESGSVVVDNLSPSALSANPSRSGAMFGAGKRYRTQMSSVQIRVMRAIFSSYKTPSLTECEILGQQIGLGKRVVQVWFQNSRAKEKKANFSDVGSPANSNGLFPQLGNSPTSCNLCNVTYSINHTLQDHLFTKPHIDRVKSVVNSSEFGKSFSGVAFGESDVFDQHKISSAKLLPQTKSTTNSPTVILTKTTEPVGNLYGNNSNNSAKNVSLERNNKRPQETQLKVSRDQPSDPGKNILNAGPVLSSALPFVNPLDAGLRQFMGVPGAPTDLIGAMMPYIYPGGAMPSVLPGFNPVQLLSQTPNILPDMTNVLLNSAAMCGIQLIQLQIPKRAIEQIQDHLKDASCATANYSEDCLTATEVKTHLTPEEFVWLIEKTIHVGYICKKCHMVFPQVDACNAHQVMLCFKDSERFGDSVLKLEQRLYQCSRCKVTCSTVKEFRIHCAQEKHRKATNSEVGNSTSRSSSAVPRLGTSQQQAESTVSKEGRTSSRADVKLENEDG